MWKHTFVEIRLDSDVANLILTKVVSLSSRIALAIKLYGIARHGRNKVSTVTKTPKIIGLVKLPRDNRFASGTRNGSPVLFLKKFKFSFQVQIGTIGVGRLAKKGDSFVLLETLNMWLFSQWHSEHPSRNKFVAKGPFCKCEIIKLTTTWPSQTIRWMDPKINKESGSKIKEKKLS